MYLSLHSPFLDRTLATGTGNWPVSLAERGRWLELGSRIIVAYCCGSGGTIPTFESSQRTNLLQQQRSMQ